MEPVNVAEEPKIQIGATPLDLIGRVMSYVTGGADEGDIFFQLDALAAVYAAVARQPEAEPLEKAIEALKLIEHKADQRLQGQHDEKVILGLILRLARQTLLLLEGYTGPGEETPLRLLPNELALLEELAKKAVTPPGPAPIFDRKAGADFTLACTPEAIVTLVGECRKALIYARDCRIRQRRAEAALREMSGGTPNRYERARWSTGSSHNPLLREAMKAREDHLMRWFQSTVKRHGLEVRSGEFDLYLAPIGSAPEDQCPPKR